MKQLKMLTCKLYKKDRKGNDSTFSLPVLTIHVSDDDYYILIKRPQSPFNIKVNTLTISDYIAETPGVLFIDSPLFLSEAPDGWRLSHINQAEC